MKRSSRRRNNDGNSRRIGSALSYRLVWVAATNLPEAIGDAVARSCINQRVAIDDWRLDHALKSQSDAYRSAVQHDGRCVGDLYRRLGYLRDRRRSPPSTPQALPLPQKCDGYAL